MKKSIIVVLAILHFSAPCFAIETEATANNTLWQMNVFGIITDVGFYGGEIYFRFPGFSNDFNKAEPSEYGGNDFICFFMWDVTSVGFVLPSIGLGFAWDTRYLILPPALMIKIQDNWMP